MKDGSLSLVSDALHNMTDVFGLVIAWLGYALMHKPKYKVVSIYAAFANTGLLLFSSAWMLFESYGRYHSNQKPIALTMIFLASIGFFINYISAKLFHVEHHHDLNIKSAYLHLMADAGISLGVAVTGVIIYFKSIYWMDPVVSALISILIILGTWRLFKESVSMLLGKTPASVNLAHIEKSILSSTKIKSLAKLRVWALSTSENAISAEIVLNTNFAPNELDELKQRLKKEHCITQVKIEII